MWRLLHRLFGWHYVYYRDSATGFVARVQEAPNGRLQMTPGGTRSHYTAFMLPNGMFENNEGTGTWKPLTWDEYSEFVACGCGDEHDSKTNGGIVILETGRCVNCIAGYIASCEPNALHQLQPEGPSEASFWNEVPKAVVEKMSTACDCYVSALFLDSRISLNKPLACINEKNSNVINTIIPLQRASSFSSILNTYIARAEAKAPVPTP